MKFELEFYCHFRFRFKWVISVSVCSKTNTSNYKISLKILATTITQTERPGKKTAIELLLQQLPEVFNTQTKLISTLLTFKCFRCTWGMVFVRMELQSQLLVSLLKVIIIAVFSNTENLVVIFASAYSASAICCQHFLFY